MEAKEKANRCQREAEEANAKLGYVTQDKEHLAVQVRALEERASASEGRLAREEASVAELHVELLRAKEALVSANKEAGESLARRLEGEQLRWLAQAKAAQEAQAEAHAAALNTHKDSRELALADADTWQTRYSELKREHEARARVGGGGGAPSADGRPARGGAPQGLRGRRQAACERPLCHALGDRRRRPRARRWSS